MNNMDEEKTKKLFTAILIGILVIIGVFCIVFSSALIWLLKLVY